MIKVTYCLRRLPHLSREAFQRYWLEVHGPLVKKHAAALRVRRYIQHHTGDHAANETIRKVRKAPEAYDGVAELWWDSMADYEAAFSSTAGKTAGKALFEDEREFIDWQRSPLWIGEEKILIDG